MANEVERLLGRLTQAVEQVGAQQVEIFERLNDQGERIARLEEAGKSAAASSSKWWEIWKIILASVISLLVSGAGAIAGWAWFASRAKNGGGP